MMSGWCFWIIKKNTFISPHHIIIKIDSSSVKIPRLTQTIILRYQQNIIAIDNKFEEWILQKWTGFNDDLTMIHNLELRGSSNKFPDFFGTGIYNCWRLLKIQYLIAIHLIRWPINFYDFSFKWTAIVGIGIHPTKAWFFRRTLCNKILF